MASLDDHHCAESGAVTEVKYYQQSIAQSAMMQVRHRPLTSGAVLPHPGLPDTRHWGQ